MSEARQQRFLHALARLNLRFPVAEIAKKTGFAESTVSTYISKRQISAKFLRKFCEAFNLDFTELWSDSKDAEKRRSERVFEEESFILNDDGEGTGQRMVPKNEEAFYKLVEGNRILATAQQEAIATAKDAVATAMKIADGNLKLIESNNKLATLLVEMQVKSATEQTLKDNQIGADAKLKVLQVLLIQDGIGKHWKTYDEGEAILSKQISLEIQNMQATDIHADEGR